LLRARAIHDHDSRFRRFRRAGSAPRGFPGAPAPNFCVARAFSSSREIFPGNNQRRIRSEQSGFARNHHVSRDIALFDFLPCRYFVAEDERAEQRGNPVRDTMTFGSPRSLASAAKRAAPPAFDFFRRKRGVKDDVGEQIEYAREILRERNSSPRWIHPCSPRSKPWCRAAAASSAICIALRFGSSLLQHVRGETG